MNLNHVTLRVADLERSVAFYKSLGLVHIVADERYARFACPEGASTLSLEADGGPVPPGAVSVHFETESLDARVAELERRGLVFEQRPIDQPYLWREAILRDPDGHPLFLFFAGENRLNPPWRLS
jgi:catechol 2,3-dioxygenase-like lactoylglutathione lyase family enzyme